jgi:transcriptional regulator with XRE-family HTH domain/quercetin dioxygenase-like cupin family protein
VLSVLDADRDSRSLDDLLAHADDAGGLAAGVHPRCTLAARGVAVPPHAVPPVGERIRAARLARGLSLRALAREVGVSASLISQVETGKSQPSVSTLYAVTTALRISVEELFDAREEPVRAVAAAAAAAPATTGQPVRPEYAGTVLGALAALASDADRRVGPVVRPPERDVLELESGVVWERLGRIPGTLVDFLLVTYAPGGSSSSTEQLMRHPGAEYGYLVEGELVLTLGFDEYRLGPGDAVSFSSTTPHRYRNEGDVPAVGVWFVAESMLT